MRRPEPPIVEFEGATLADTEEVDAINRSRWLRLMLRHNALRKCVCLLAEGGVTAKNPACP